MDWRGKQHEKGSTMNSALHQEIEALRRQKTKALRARYRELFGEESRSSNHAHLFRRIAWRLQAIEEGDLSERARERATALAADIDLRLRPPRKFWNELSDRAARKEADRARRDPRLPAIGTVLERQYQGRSIRVQVLEDGFEWEGKEYDSLSSIASSVAGTRWNGFSFFRLRKGIAHG
jgi:hypothetical protein